MQMKYEMSFYVLQRTNHFSVILNEASTNKRKNNAIQRPIVSSDTIGLCIEKNKNIPLILQILNLVLEIKKGIKTCL